MAEEALVAAAPATESVHALPFSLEAERAVIGGVMLANESFDAVVDVLSESDFYEHRHRVIFRILELLAGQSSPLDVITVSESLEQTGEIERAGGAAYIIELAHNTPSASNIMAYAEIVRHRSVLRQLIQVAGEISKTAYNPQGRSTSELLDEAERRIFQISNQHVRGQGPRLLREILMSTIEKIDKLMAGENALTGQRTGFTDLDEKTAGFQNSDMIIIAGRPSMGKTTFAMNIAENIATQKDAGAVLIFSLEMPSEQIATKILSAKGSIELNQLRSGKLSDATWGQLVDLVAVLTDMTLLIDDTPALTPTELRARARRVAREYGKLGLIVIDYLQLMRIPGFHENRTNEISEISRSLKALAKELNVPVVALSQLNRELGKKAIEEAVMSDLRESGAIEQDADLILFVYRDEVYNEHSEQKGIAEIIIGKHRNGPTGTIKLTFQGQYSRFTNYAPDYYG